MNDADDMLGFRAVRVAHRFGLGDVGFLGPCDRDSINVHNAFLAARPSRLQRITVRVRQRGNTRNCGQGENLSGAAVGGISRVKWDGNSHCGLLITSRHMLAGLDAPHSELNRGLDVYRHLEIP